MKRADACYRALLRCYPAAFRDEYGRQMLLMFTEQLGYARRAGARFAPAALWGQAAVDALTIAPKEHWHVIREDLRYALRTIAVRPGFAVVAILSLALGIGANTALFSLWNGVLHAALPGVRAPGQLVILSNPDSAGSWTGSEEGPRRWLTYAEFEQLRDHAGSFSGVMASQSSLDEWQIRLDDGGWEKARGRLVSGGFFEVLGAGAAMGRLFTAADDRGEPRTVVISHSYWQRRFAGAADVIGRTLTVRNAAAVTIIGVAARGFIGETSGQQPDVWFPIRLQPSLLPGADRLHDTPPTKSMWLHLFARLKPGVTPAQAEAEANALFRAGLESFYGTGLSELLRRELMDQRLVLRPAAGGASTTRPEFSQSLTALLAAVGVLLLIACANLANLLLARGAARRPEIALRLSLGASRSRIVRQLVTESLVLAALGGVAAIAVAAVLHGALVRMIAETEPDFRMRFAVDPLLLAFVLGATVAAALLFGVLPAWQVTRTDAGDTLRTLTRGAVGTAGQGRSGRVLVGLQLALSLPLLVSAGLLARSVYNLQHADLGFPADRLLMVRVDLGGAPADEARRDSLRRRLLGEIQRIPGVRAASFSHLGLFSGGESSSTIEAEGDTPRAANDRGSGRDAVGPGYFSALGIPIVQGRDILEEDRAGALQVCVINEAFAKRFFDGRNPIGLRITGVGTAERPEYRVVGVAGNARTTGLRGTVRPRFFVSAPQRLSSANSPTFLIRTVADAAPVMTAVQKTIERVDGSLPILSASSLEEQMLPLTAQDRATARLAVVFGAVALSLAAIGLYGVLSYGIACRTSEIAVRIALGARPGRVVSLILRETLVVVGAGLVVGGGLAYGASRLIDNRLYGVAPQDPVILALATMVLLSVALGAAYLPAQRASRLDPMAALRRQ